MESLAWRLPLALVALALAWSRLSRRGPALAVVVGVALAVDAFIPAARPAAEVAARTAMQIGALQQRLAALAEEPRISSFLYPGGREAEPEAPFPLLEGAARSFPAHVDALVLVDDNGLPVAWTGPVARLPVRLRPLGNRVAAAEPGVGSVWLWCREPVFEGGRPLGALLAGIELPESGRRTILGVWVGRVASVVPVVGGGSPVLQGGLVSSLGVEVRPTRAEVWSAPGLALLLALAVLCVGRGLVLPLLLLGVSVSLLPVFGWATGGWWVVVGIVGVAACARWLPRGLPGRLAGAVTAGVVGCVLPGLFALLELEPVPARLLWPGALRWALVASLALMLRNVAGRSWAVAWPIRVASWVPMLVVFRNPSASGLGVAAAAVSLLGLPGRGLLLPAALAAGLLVSGEDVARRDRLVAVTEATLAQHERIELPARTMLASLPEQGLADLVALEPEERLVVLGRLATWLNLAQTLPGTSLALADRLGAPAGVWGEGNMPTAEQPRVIATRTLRNGWQVAVLTPPPPADLLGGLAAAGLAQPLAVFDRSGAPTGRGAIFRPLSPLVVGRALAEGSGWDTVGVGKRELAAYFRAHHDGVLVVPWLRRPLAEEGLMAAALTLWGAFPLTGWERRRRWRNWWRRRRTFAGRVRLLAVATAVLPVLLLGPLLPQQWSRQQAKARQELGRGLSQFVTSARAEKGLASLVGEMGGAVAVYRSGRLVSSTRLDLVELGRIPGLPPAEAYVRSVRGWREPVIVGGEETDMYAPLREGEEPVVVGIVGLRLEALGHSPSPGEWFVVAGLFAMMTALATAERLSRRLSRPLRRLVGAAQRLARGEPVARLETGGDEDVRALGHAFVSMAREVRRREEELRGERDLLESVLGTLSTAVLVADGAGQIELANAAAATLAAGERQLAALAANFAPKLTTLVARGTAGERAEETVHPLGSPEALWRVTVLPLAGGGGRILVVMEDLSELARAERLSSLAELARIAAHEVKNPLTPIRLWAEELKAALDRGPDSVVEVARLAAPQILDRVEQLREVAQGFANLVALEHWEPRVIALRALAEEVVAEYEVLAQRGVAVRVEGDEAEVSADALWVRRALRHLLENSIRVLGPSRGEIVVAVRKQANQVVLSVRDTGGGAPTELLGRLFEPHFSTTSEGSGLGLAVVQRVVARAGGSVEASNVGAGLEVRLTFPARAE
jgi:signal transduction histidine kinase